MRADDRRISNIDAPGPVGFVCSVVLFLALGLVAFGIYLHTEKAVAVPIYDPGGYMLKAYNVWPLISKGEISGVLNAEPSARPPGCVPFCYPFGYDSDFHSFLFWSTFSPIAIWALSLWLGLSYRAKTASDLKLSCVFCLGLVSMPMFYHFELNSTLEVPFVGQWGLQDCLLAAFAALSTSVVMIGAARQNLGVTTIGWIASAYALLIKPAGSLVMLAMPGIWLTEIIILLASNRSLLTNRKTIIYMVLSIVTYIIICGGLTYACLHSLYLGQENVAFYVNAQHILISITSVDIATAFQLLGPTIGWVWAIPLIVLYLGAFIAGVTRLVRGKWIESDFRIYTSALILLASAYWFVEIAGLAARYYLPFPLIIIAWLLPDTLGFFRRLPPYLRGLLTVYAITPALVFFSLLLSSSPSISTQLFLGYNMSTGGFGEQVDIAKRLINESHKLNRQLQIYAYPDYESGEIFTYDYIKSFSSKSCLKFVFILDWVRPPGLRISDIEASDYLAVVSDGSPVPPLKIENLDDERYAWNDWVKNLKPEDGIERIASGSSNVVRVRDPKRLAKSFCDMVAQHEWRKAFIDNNPEIANQIKGIAN